MVRITEEQIHLLRVGWRNLFTSCAVVLCHFLVQAGNAGTRSILFPADCFGIKREKVFGVTYVISVQYSCAVVSVFLLFEYLTVTIISQKNQELSL